jgi:hypothetical protein
MAVKTRNKNEEAKGAGATGVLPAPVIPTALQFAHYNFVRRHQTIRCSPAMAAGVASTLWSVEDLVEAALDGVRK